MKKDKQQKYQGLIQRRKLKDQCKYDTIFNHTSNQVNKIKTMRPTFNPLD